MYRAAVSEDNFLKRKKFDIREYRHSSLQEADIFALKEIYDLFADDETGEVHVQEVFEILEAVDVPISAKFTKFSDSEAYKLFSRLLGLCGSKTAKLRELDRLENERKKEERFRQRLRKAKNRVNAGKVDRPDVVLLADELSSDEENDFLPGDVGDPDPLEPRDPQSSGTNQGSGDEDNEGANQKNGKGETVDFDIFLRIAAPLLKEDDNHYTLRNVFSHLSGGAPSITVDALVRILPTLGVDASVDEVIEMIGVVAGTPEATSISFDDFYSIMVQRQ